MERDTSYELDQSYFKYKDVAHQRFVIMCVMACLLLIAVFCIINLVMRNRELKADLGEDDEEDEDDEDGTKLKEDAWKKIRRIREDKSADAKEGKPVTEKASAKKTEKGPLAETVKGAEKKPDTEGAKRAEKKTEAGTVKRAAKRPEGEALRKAAKNPEGESGKPAAETVKKAAKRPVREGAKEAAKDVEIDPSSLEEKIINQIQLDSEMPAQSDERPREAKAGRERVRPQRKPSNFKMINLSREPEASALDDDFEFEFINLDED